MIQAGLPDLEKKGITPRKKEPANVYNEYMAISRTRPMLLVV